MLWPNVSVCVYIYIYYYHIRLLILLYLQESTAFDALLIKGAFFVSHLFEQKWGTPIQFEKKLVLHLFLFSPSWSLLEHSSPMISSLNTGFLTATKTPNFLVELTALVWNSAACDFMSLIGESYRIPHELDHEADSGVSDQTNDF